MKKVLIIAFSLLLLVGCNKKEEVVEKKEPVVKFTLEKIDNDKDYVYFSNYKEVVFKDDRYLYKYIIKAVTEGHSYVYLKTKLDIPCSRDTYYDRYRKFFWLLSSMRG